MQNINTKKLVLGMILLLVLIVVGTYTLTLISQRKPNLPNTVPILPPSSVSNGTPENRAKEVVIPKPPVFSGKQTIDVTIQGFDPKTITVKTGTLITWINKTGKDSAIASDPHPTHRAYPSLNLGKFPDGNGVSLIFDKAGTYGYHNHFIPAQTGKVVVE